MSLRLRKKSSNREHICSFAKDLYKSVDKFVFPTGKVQCCKYARKDVCISSKKKKSKNPYKGRPILLNYQVKRLRWRRNLLWLKRILSDPRCLSKCKDNKVRNLIFENAIVHGRYFYKSYETLFRSIDLLAKSDPKISNRLAGYLIKCRSKTNNFAWNINRYFSSRSYVMTRVVQRVANRQTSAPL